MFETAGDYVDIVKLGWGTSYVTRNLREKVQRYHDHGDARDVRRHPARGGRRPRPGGGVPALEPGGRLHARRGLGRHAADGARSKQELISLAGARTSSCCPRSDRRIGRDLRALPVGRLDQRGARGGRLEGDHRGPRDRHRRHLPRHRRGAQRPDRRDRPRDPGGQPAVRGAAEGPAGLVRPPPRPRGQPRQHARRTRSSRWRRCGSACAPTRCPTCCSATCPTPT